MKTLKTNNQRQFHIAVANPIRPHFAFRHVVICDTKNLIRAEIDNLGDTEF
mgnify:CR=1 FL=1